MRCPINNLGLYCYFIISMAETRLYNRYVLVSLIWPPKAIIQIRSFAQIRSSEFIFKTIEVSPLIFCQQMGARKEMEGPEAPGLQ